MHDPVYEWPLGVRGNKLICAAPLKPVPDNRLPAGFRFKTCYAKLDQFFSLDELIEGLRLHIFNHPHDIEVDYMKLIQGKDVPVSLPSTIPGFAPAIPSGTGTGAHGSYPYTYAAGGTIPPSSYYSVPFTTSSATPPVTSVLSNPWPPYHWYPGPGSSGMSYH